MRRKNLHDELYQIIVSKKELYYQLDRFCLHDNLIKLFSVTVDSEEYRRLLTLVSVKLELIGSFNYVSKKDGEKELRKPLENTYKRLFDGYCESLDECKMRIGSDDNIVAEKIFNKYKAVKYYCVKMLATTIEQNYAAEFAGILDYVAKNNVFLETEFSEFCGFPVLLQKQVEKFNWDIFDIHG